MDTPPYILDDNNDEYNDEQQLQLISPVLSFSLPDTPLSFAGEEEHWESEWILDNNDYPLVLDRQQSAMELFPIDTTAAIDLHSNLAGLGISVPDHHRNSMFAENFQSLPSNERDNPLETVNEWPFVQDTYYRHQTFPKKTDIQKRNSLRQPVRRFSSNNNTTTVTTGHGMRRHSTPDRFV